MYRYLFVLVLCLAVPAGASAATFVATYDYTVENLWGGVAFGPPVHIPDTITGFFSVEFDTSTNNAFLFFPIDSMSDVTLESGFVYTAPDTSVRVAPAGTTAYVHFGGTIGGPHQVAGLSDDFFLYFPIFWDGLDVSVNQALMSQATFIMTNAVSAPTPFGGAFNSDDITVTLRSVAPVPLPAPGLLLALALLGLGPCVRTRRAR